MCVARIAESAEFRAVVIVVNTRCMKRYALHLLKQGSSRREFAHFQGKQELTNVHFAHFGSMFVFVAEKYPVNPVVGQTCNTSGTTQEKISRW